MLQLQTLRRGLPPCTASWQAVPLYTHTRTCLRHCLGKCAVRAQGCTAFVATRHHPLRLRCVCVSFGTTKPQKGCGANRLINPYFIDSRVRRSFLCGSAISLLATGDSEGGRVGASAAAWNAAPLAGGRVGSTSTADPMERPASMRTAMVGSAYVHTRTCLRHRFRQVRRACLGCARRSSQPTTTPLRLLCVRFLSPGPPNPKKGAVRTGYTVAQL